jgi:hypothetical protein
VTSFLAVSSYNPLLVLMTGLLTFTGLWALGTGLLFCLRLDFPRPWNHVAAILLGIQVLSLSVQIVAMAAIASQTVLIAIWYALVSFGALTIVFLVSARHRTLISMPSKSATFPFAIIAIALATNLLIAVAPSTKIDELYYHMLVPSRIVSDGALRFYLEPWPAAILPDMVFQIAAAPLHALGYPDAPNVVSWAISATLVWFTKCIIRGNLNTSLWSSFWICGLCVGLYPAIWHVTGGAHAMGDLAVTAAVSAFFSRENLLRDLSSPAYAALMSILLLAATTSKITLLPLSVAILLIVSFRLYRSLPSEPWQTVIAIGAPWIIFYCPIMIWTWHQSGSPFGPVLSGMTGNSVYPAGWAEETFKATRQFNEKQLSDVFAYTAVNYSPLIWLGVASSFFLTSLSAATRIILLAFFMMQCGIIHWFLADEVRYLSGLQFGLFLAFASHAHQGIQRKFVTSRIFTAGFIALILPWLGLQVFYGKQFFLVSLGLENTAFYERHVAFYSDYLALDKLLPKDATILVTDFIIDSVYMPRPVVFDSRDLPQHRPVFWFALAEGIQAAGVGIADYKIGKFVYENTRAVTTTYRTPGREPELGTVQIFSLIH